jgi:hypothetical protein
LYHSIVGKLEPWRDPTSTLQGAANIEAIELRLERGPAPKIRPVDVTEQTWLLWVAQPAYINLQTLRDEYVEWVRVTFPKVFV